MLYYLISYKLQFWLISITFLGLGSKFSNLQATYKRLLRPEHDRNANQINDKFIVMKYIKKCSISINV